MKPLPPDLRELATARLSAAPAAERGAVCDEIVRQHPAFGDALQRLRRRIDGAERLLDRSFPAPPPDDDPPELGGYRVVRRLGEGAFGTVYLCEQQHPIARRVAVKVLRPGAGDRHTLARFAAERQVLAGLGHPAITPIHDAGHLPDGRPFFVMEFVDGVPLAAFCRSASLDLPATLRLFVRVCHGVEHAHGRGVVHRDLKPANVLVVAGGSDGGEPQPKIIDFGIAKALTREDAEAAGVLPGSLPPTDVGRVLGTPGYMSPEQAAGRTDHVDARSDVWALGVMLYELLAGELPWRRGVSGDDVSDPPLPSQRLATNAARDDRDGRDGTAARRAAARVRGELDWITAKAMSRDRAGRYATARELADDLERHLAHRPVLAGPPTVGYRLRRFVRRHRTAVFAFAAIGLAAIAGVLGVLAARDTTGAALSEALTTADRLLERANSDAVLDAPQHDPLRSALAGDALDVYDRWLRQRPDDAALRARRAHALLTLADVHVLLGEAARAEPLAQEVEREATALLEPSPDDVDARELLARALQQQVRVLHLRQDHTSSLPLCERAIAAYDAVIAARPALAPLFGMALVEHAHALTMARRHEDSLVPLERAIALLEAAPAGTVAPGDIVTARANRAATLMQLAELDDADADLEHCEAVLPSLRRGRERITTLVLGQRAEIAARRGDHAAAASGYARAIDASETWARREPGHVRARYLVFEGRRRHAEALAAAGDWTGADESAARALASGEDWLAAFPRDVIAVHELRVGLYSFAHARWSRFRRSDLQQAAAWLRRCDELGESARAIGAAPDPLPWVVRTLAAQVADAAGEPTDAAWDALAAELPADRALRTGEHANVVVEGWLGVTRSRHRRGDVAGATTALTAAERFLAAVDDKLRSEAAWWRARLAVRRGDHEAAAAAAADVVRHRGSWWGHWRAGDAEAELAAALAPVDAAASAAARDRAAARYRAVADALAPKAAATPDDPWPVVPWGMASLALATLEADRGDPAAAQTRVVAALAALQRVAPEAHRDLFDEARVAAGRELAARLTEPRD